MSLLISKVGWEAGPLRSTRPDGQQCSHSASEALWLSERRAEKSRSAGMCVLVYDYTWWEEDILFKRAVRLGSGNASDVALEAVHVFTFTTRQAARVVLLIAAGLSVAQEHAYEQTQALRGLPCAILCILSEFYTNEPSLVGYYMFWLVNKHKWMYYYIYRNPFYMLLVNHPASPTTII